MAENSNVDMKKKDKYEENMTDMAVNDNEKPKHVRKLSFGETILNLNTVDRATGLNDNKIIVDEEVEGIPKTEKKDFVRNWIEIHNNDEDLSSKEFTEPVQGSLLSASTSKSLPNASPILGVRKYQNNERPESDNNVKKNDQASTSPILSSSKRIYRKKSNSPAEEKQSELYKHDHQFNINNILSVNNSENNSSQNVIVNKSPELVRDANDHNKSDKQDFTNNIQMAIESHVIHETNNYDNRNMNLQPLNQGEHSNHSDPGWSMPVTFNINDQMTVESNNMNETDHYSIRNIISQPLVPYESFNHSGLGCSMPATIPWIVRVPTNDVIPNFNETDSYIRNMISIPSDPYESLNHSRPRYFRPAVINENVQMDNVISNVDESNNSSDIDMISKPLNLSKNSNHSDPECSMPVNVTINSQVNRVIYDINETINYGNRNMNLQPFNQGEHSNHSDPGWSMPVTFNINDQMTVESNNMNETDHYSIRNIISQPLVPYESFNHSGLGCSMPATIPWIVRVPTNAVIPNFNETDSYIRNMISIPSDPYESLNHFRPRYFRPAVINENVQMDNVISNVDESNNSSDIDMISKPLNLSKNSNHSDPECSMPVNVTINSQVNRIIYDINETINYGNRNMNLQTLNQWEHLNHSSPEFSMSAARQRKIDSIEVYQEGKIDASKNIIVPTSSKFDIIEDDIIIDNCLSDKNTFNKRQNLNSPSPEFSMSAAKKRKIDYVKGEEKTRQHSIIMYALKNEDISPPPNPPVIEVNVIIKNNTIDENSSVIESVSSDDSNTTDQIEITNLKSDDDEIHHENIVIEDTDNNKDMIPLVNNSISGSDTELKTSCDVTDKGSVASSKDLDGIYYKIESNKSIFPFKIKTKWANASLKDFGETSYSETESMKSESFSFQNEHSFEKISQITSLSNGSVDNTSSSTSCISTPTSPEKINSFPAMSLQILDSNKKQRKVKKKSLTAKLQSLVSRQISFVRIWQHQVKQADVDGTLIPHVDVYVDKCTTHMNRQFLEGFVLNDSFHLLNNNSNQENDNLGESSYRMITIHIVPDIVGKIEMKLESIVKIYPPWDIMDESKLVLNITYIKMVSNEQRRAILHQINIPDRKKRKILMKESDCVCLEAKKIISSCKETSDNIRVNVMNEIYNF